MKGLDFSILPKSEDCFAEAHGKCTVLINRWCQGHNECSMYKTEEQAKIDHEKAFARLRSLPLEKQEHIAGLYYGKKMPWYEVNKK